MSCSRDQWLYIPSEGCGTRCTYSLGLEAEWAPLEAEGVVVHLHADSLGRLLRVDLEGLVSGQRRADYLPLALFQLPPYKKSTPESPKVGVPLPCVVPVAVCEEYG